MNTEKMLLNMALKSMKDNFLSLDDEKKQKEFNRLLDENQELKAKIKTYEDLEDLTLMFMYCDEKAKDKIKELNKQLKNKYSKIGTLTSEVLYEENTKLINQQQEFIEYLENEKDRLARECSHMYKNSLGKTILVNEDIFNEVDTILSKYKSIIGGKDE